MMNRANQVTLAACLAAALLAGCDRASGAGDAAPAPPAAAAQQPAPESAPQSQPSPGPQTRANWEPIEREAMHQATQAQVDKGLRAQQDLGKSLMAALTTSVAADGFDESLPFCRGVAPDLATKIGEKWGVKIGRTSHRLRNPENAAPRWATPLVEARRAEQTFVLGPHGELGILSPIPMAELCTNCHGTKDALAAGVEAAVTKLYPKDEATGFGADDLRGWFWVEVPPPS